MRTASAASRGLPKMSPSSTTSVSADQHRQFGELALLHPLPADGGLRACHPLDVVQRRLAVRAPSIDVAIAAGRLAQQQQVELDAELAQQFLPPRTLGGEVECGGIRRDLEATSSFAMIRVPGEHARRAIQLLGSTTRARGRAAASSPTAPAAPRAALDAGVEAVGAADDERDVVARQRASVQVIGELARRPRRPRSSSATIGRPPQAARSRTASAASICATRPAAIARLGLQLDQRRASIRAAAASRIRRTRRSPRPASGGRGRRREACKRDPAGARRSAPPAVRSRGSCAGGPRACVEGVRPQLLEVVVGAHRGLHHVDDDVARVDEHPFAGLLAFDADDRRAGLLQLVADVAARAP